MLVLDLIADMNKRLLSIDIYYASTKVGVHMKIWVSVWHSANLSASGAQLAPNERRDDVQRRGGNVGLAVLKRRFF